MKKKLLYPIFDGIVWTTKHKKINILSNVIAIAIIVFVTDQTILDWQFWIMLLAGVFLIQKAYFEGRNDEDVFQKKMQKEIPDIIAKDIVKALSKQGIKAKYKDPLEERKRTIN